MGKWIDISVIPPPMNTPIIIRVTDLECDVETDVGIVDEFCNWTTFNDWEEGCSITHWMPLPYPDLE